ncbi:MAG: hypothetical protein HDQ88_08585 [Clostridia bacterium]|nr:hypothetical protein [Clostridia bacterium]
MGKQLRFLQTDDDEIALVKYLFDQNYTLSYGVPYETGETLTQEEERVELDGETVKFVTITSKPVKLYDWKYFEINTFDKFLTLLSDKQIRRLSTQLFSVYRGKNTDLEPYNKKYTQNLSYSDYPMIEFSSERIWLDSRAKGNPIWDDYEAIKKWIKKNYVYDKEKEVYLGKEYLKTK